MHLVFIDAYDSFSHNILHALRGAGASVEMIACDATDAQTVYDMAPDGIVLGPGPGRAEDAGCFLPLVRAWDGSTPLFGICLGMQALATGFGGHCRTGQPMHGQTTEVHHHHAGLFAGLPSPVAMARYNSIEVDAASLPADVHVAATDANQVPMAIAHASLLAWGVQFHPESVLSEAYGPALLRNFVRMVRVHSAAVASANVAAS